MTDQADERYYARDAEYKRVLGQEVVYAPELIELPKDDPRPRGWVVELVEMGTTEPIQAYVRWSVPNLGVSIENTADLIALGDDVTRARREADHRQGKAPGRRRRDGRGIL